MLFLHFSRKGQSSKTTVKRYTEQCLLRTEPRLTSVNKYEDLAENRSNPGLQKQLLKNIPKALYTGRENTANVISGSRN